MRARVSTTLAFVAAALISPLLSLPACAADLTEGIDEDVVAEMVTPEIQPVTATATRISRPLGAVPASVIVLDRARIEAASGQRLDDLLRSVPGFSLFRRQPSLMAHPTTQGATLRGIGATGASRALVLVDGIPVQDPFGGWVYWGRIPREIIERIEVVRGGGSSLWGSGAMSGVINVITRPPDGNRAVVSAEKGNRHTTNVETLGERAWSGAALRADGAYLDSGGEYLVAGGDRVPFDTRADSRELTLGMRTDWSLSPRWSASLDGRYFDEKRDNGTELGDNETDNFSAHAGIEGESAAGSGFRADVYGQLQEFESRFSSQDRTAGIELPSLDQFDVPSGSLGFGGRAWSEPAPGHIALIGMDYMFVDGHTDENFRYIDGEFTRRRKAGGREHTVGAYVQDIWRPLARLELTTGLRVDYWRSEDGERRETDLAAGADLVDQSLPAKDDVFVSPRVGALYQLYPALALRASAYRGFRAPTLNELYRPFRVRNDITEANADLDLERLTGAEVGFDAVSGRATLRRDGVLESRRRSDRQRHHRGWAGRRAALRLRPRRRRMQAAAKPRRDAHARARARWHVRADAAPRASRRLPLQRRGDPFGGLRRGARGQRHSTSARASSGGRSRLASARPTRRVPRDPLRRRSVRR